MVCERKTQNYSCFLFQEHWKVDPFSADKMENGDIYARGTQVSGFFFYCKIMISAMMLEIMFMHQ